MASHLEEEGVHARGEVTYGVSDGEKYGSWLDKFGLPRGARAAAAAR